MKFYNLYIFCCSFYLYIVQWENMNIYLVKVLRKVKPDLCFENLKSLKTQNLKKKFGQGKRGHNFSCSIGWSVIVEERPKMDTRNLILQKKQSFWIFMIIN